MQDHLINVNIRPHLISFLFQEFEGETTAFYDGKKAKLAKISKSSLIGKMITAFKELEGEPITSRLHSFSIYLTIKKNGEVKGLFHEKYDNNHTVLQLLPSHSLILNELLESMFRVSAVEFIKGYAQNSSSYKFVNEAIHEFMILHNLYDTEVDPISIRAFYYNSIKKKHSLTRLQNQIGNRSLYYYSA